MRLIEASLYGIAVAIIIMLLIKLAESFGKPEAEPNRSSKGWPGDDTLCAGRRFPVLDPLDDPTLELDTVFLGDLPIADKDNSDEQPRPPI